MAMNEKLTGVSYAELIGGTAVTPMLKNITLGSAAAVAIPKGTLLKVDGTICAKTETASYVLAKDAEKGAKVITAYSRGQFNAEKLVAQSGDTVLAHENELRAVGILLTSLK